MAIELVEKQCECLTTTFIWLRTPEEWTFMIQCGTWSIVSSYYANRLQMGYVGYQNNLMSFLFFKYVLSFTLRNICWRYNTLKMGRVFLEILYLYLLIYLSIQYTDAWKFGTSGIIFDKPDVLRYRTLLAIETHEFSSFFLFVFVFVLFCFVLFCFVLFFNFKATVLSLYTFRGLPCLVQLLTWLHVSITVIFGTLKDGSLEINSLALNHCFSYRNVWQNGVKAFSKMVLKNSVFCQKVKILCSLAQ